MRFRALHPDKAYRGSMLWVPKALVPLDALETSLTYWFTEPTPSGEYVARAVRVWAEDVHHIALPREFPREKVPCEVIDLAPPTEHYTFASTIRPRDEVQVAAIAAMRSNQSGILNLGCGRGKTVVGLDRIAFGQGPALVIVNDKGLLAQWHKEAMDKLQLDADEIGQVHGAKAEWDKPLVLATVQTLWRRIKDGLVPEWVRRRFATVLYDEAHHMAALEFNRVASFFTGHRFGLTATRNRTDGNERFFEVHLGPILYTDLSVDVPPTVYFAHTGLAPTSAERDGFYTNDMVNVVKVRQWQAQNKLRNGMIGRLAQNAQGAGHKVLVLSHLRDGHIPLLQEVLPGCGVVSSKVKGKKRLTNLTENDIVVGTMGAAREGLDRPDLSVVVFTTTFANENDFQQASGRVARACDGKVSSEAVFIVDHVPKCQDHAKLIARFARKRGYRVEHFQLEKQ
jgi:hypothetical protein